MSQSCFALLLAMLLCPEDVSILTKVSKFRGTIQVRMVDWVGAARLISLYYGMRKNKNRFSSSCITKHQNVDLISNAIADVCNKGVRLKVTNIGEV